MSAKKSVPPLGTKTHFVGYLPDLMTEEDYLDGANTKKIRVRIQTTEDGVEVLGDSMYAHLIEALLSDLGAEAIERMLCG